MEGWEEVSLAFVLFLWWCFNKDVILVRVVTEE